MAPSLLLLLLLLIFIFPCANSQPSPGYYPNSKIAPSGFHHLIDNRWGPQHQKVSQDESSLTVWLDKSSGSGFKSIRPYGSGYFGASVKLQAGYTAGVNTAFYISTP